MNKVNLLTIFLGFMAFVAYTQPNGFNYQAIARETNGDPMVKKNVTVKFNISTTEIATPIWCETHENISTGEFGVFTIPAVGLKANECGTIPLQDLNWKTGSFYLTVQIGDNKSKPQQLVTVPYAFYAKTAAVAENLLNAPKLEWNNNTRELSLAGNPTKVVIPGGPTNPTPISTDNTLTGNGVNIALGISNGGVSNPKIANGAVDASKLAQMGAIKDQVLKWDGTKWLPSKDAESDLWTKGPGDTIYTLKGYVGIGTNKPKEKVHINKGFIRIDSGGIDIYKINNNLFPDTLKNTGGVTNGFGIFQITGPTSYVRKAFLGADAGGYLEINRFKDDRAMIQLKAHDKTDGKYGFIGLQDIVVNGKYKAAMFLDTMKGQGVIFADTLRAVNAIIPDWTNPSNPDIGTPNNLWRNIWLRNCPTVCSDRQLKSNIKPVSYGLSDILKLRSVSYHLNADSSKQTQMGFIAQEVEPIIPEIVVKPTKPEEFYAMRYEQLIPILTKAIQEQQQIIEELKKADSEKTATNASLQKDIKNLESKLEKVLKRLDMQDAVSENPPQNGKKQD
jgi:hypothetical protein